MSEAQTLRESRIRTRMLRQRALYIRLRNKLRGAARQTTARTLHMTTPNLPFFVEYMDSVPQLCEHETGKLQGWQGKVTGLTRESYRADRGKLQSCQGKVTGLTGNSYRAGKGNFLRWQGKVTGLARESYWADRGKLQGWQGKLSELTGESYRPGKGKLLNWHGKVTGLAGKVTGLTGESHRTSLIRNVSNI